MPRPLGRVIAACLVTILALAACGNSTGKSNDATVAPTSAAGGGATKGGDENRDEAVELTDVPGVSDDEIAYTVIGTKTGNPLGICILDCYVDGVKAHFAFRNSEGGIYGRKLAIGEIVDDELTLNQQKSLDVISGGKAFGAFQATLLATGWGDLDQAGVPTYTWGIHSTEAANRPHIFPSLAVRCADCAEPGVPYVASVSKATKAASIGYGISENSKACTNSVADAFERYAKESGVTLVYTNDRLDYGLANGIGPEVTAMKAAGVDFISTCIDLNGMKTLAQELHRQKMDDVVLYHPNSYDAGYVKDAGDLFEGDVVTVQFRPLEAESDGNALETFRTWMDNQGSEPSELSMVGWINASLAFDSLLAAGPEFDRDRVTAAANAMTAYTAGGLLEPIDWTKAHTPYTADEPDPESGPACSAYVRVEGGAFVTLAPPEKPWLCFGSGADAGFEPSPTNFG